jgi:uroporphyrinogen-III decarboxylase
VVFPRNAELWKVLRDAGKRVIYCSDGDWLAFLDDIAEAGADGFVFEPMMDLTPVVARYGKTHVIVGSMVDCRTLTFGSPNDIQAEIDATLPLARQCPGFFFCVSNHIPSNVPVENGLFYFDYLSRHWSRSP